MYLNTVFKKKIILQELKKPAKINFFYNWSEKHRTDVFDVDFDSILSLRIKLIQYFLSSYIDLMFI